MLRIRAPLADAWVVVAEPSAADALRVLQALPGKRRHLRWLPSRFAIAGVRLRTLRRTDSPGSCRRAGLRSLPGPAAAMERLPCRIAVYVASRRCIAAS